jgi:hypothetical protein
MRSLSLAVVLLALTGCNQAYVELPPGPDSGPEDATTTDVLFMEAGEAGQEAETTDGGGDAGDATSDAPTDSPSDAGDATSDGTTDAESD